MELFDSHAHYNDEKFEEDRQEILKEIFEWGCITKRNSSNNTKTTPKIIISITSPFLIKKKCAVSKLALETMKLLCSLLYYNSTKKSINYRYFE